MSDDLFLTGKYRTSNHGDMWIHVIENMPDGSGRVVARCEKEEDAEKIVREHNTHAELVLCLSAILKITCGDCTGEKFKRCKADDLVCALSAQARAAVAKSKGAEE